MTKYIINLNGEYYMHFWNRALALHSYHTLLDNDYDVTLTKEETK